MPSLHLSKLLSDVLSVHPEAGRLLLRGYLHTARIVPRSASWAVEDLMRRLVPSPSTRVIRLGGGLRLEVDLSSAMGREVYYHGSTGTEVARLLDQAIRPGMTFVDAGANMGEFTVRAAGLVGSAGRVVSLEASPTTAAHLARNVRLNGLRNVTLVEAAVCESDGPRTFHLGRGPDSGSSSLSSPHDYSGESITVEGLSLDTLARHESLDRVDCIKLDVEGAELSALRGATGLLSDASPPLIVLEYHPEVARRAGWSLEDLGGFLGGLGYGLYTAGGGGIGGRVDRAPDRVCNLAAVPGRGANTLAGALR